MTTQVTTGVIADGAVTLNKMDRTGTAGFVLASNGSGAPSWAPTGSVTTLNSGSGNWTIPALGTFAFVRLWGGGGSGGRGGSTFAGAGGGGGGGYKEMMYPLAALGAAGSTVPYSVGAGGAALSAAGTGNNGGNTTFGSGSNLITAYGGGAGIGAAGTNSGGNGGGFFGSTSIAANVDSGNIWDGGRGAIATASYGATSTYLGGAGGGGTNGTNTAAGGTSVYGGQGGSPNSNAGLNAGSGTAPGGGGGGQGVNAGSSGAGGSGRLEIYVW